MTLTLELPDDLAERLEKLPPEQRNNYAVAALAYGMDALPEEENGEPDPDMVEDLKRAFAMGLDNSVTVSLEDYAKGCGNRL
jgi:hypothetical protein